MKIEKQERKIPIWAIVVALVVLGLIIAGIVCFILVKNGEAEDLKKARGLSSDIFETKVVVENYINAKTETLELTEEDKELFEDFENSIAKTSDLMKELGDCRAIKDEEAKKKYDEAAGIFEKMLDYAETEQQLMNTLSDGELNGEELDELKNGRNEYLKKIAEELKGYEAKILEFNEKYADLKGKNKVELDNDAAEIKQLGDELKNKYGSIKLDDVYGMSRDDILHFYATIEELNKYLTEKN